MKTVKPILRYFGAKWALTPWIIDQFPNHHGYIEPYGGSGAILFNKRPVNYEVYNDLNKDVVNLFKILRDEQQCEKLIRQVNLTPYSRSEYHEAEHDSPDRIEQARRFLIRSWMGFGSMYDKDVHRVFRRSLNVDTRMPSLEWASLPDRLITAAKRLKDVVIENDKASAIIERYDNKRVLIYLDPPYMTGSRGSGSSVGKYAERMSLKDHKQLLEQITSCVSKVVLSGYDHDLYNNALRSWERVEVDTRDMRGLKRTEVLWINPSAREAREGHLKIKPFDTEIKRERLR